MRQMTPLCGHFSLGLALILTLAALGSTKPIRGQVQPMESIAVLDMEGRGISAMEASTLTDRMRTELVNTGAVTVVERGQMQSVLSEQDFQLTGCTSDECAVQIGQMLGVTKMYTGSIGKIGSTYTVDVRVIDVETGAIIRTMKRDYRGEVDGLIKEIERLSWDLVGLVHPDEILEGLQEGPSLTLEEVTGRRSRPESVIQRPDAPAKKSKLGKRLFWSAVIIGGAGATYVLLSEDAPSNVSINVDIQK